MRDFVEKGGGLFWATGELSSEKAAGLGWLPATPGGPVTLRPSRSLEITQGEEAHPAFSLLGVNGGRFFSALRLARITPLEPARGGRTLLELPDGTPALVVGSVGSGQVMVWGSTCDRDWADLAVRPVFVPFMRGVSDFLGGTRKGISSSSDAGEAFEIRAPIRRAGEAIQIRGPAQEERAIQFMEKAPGLEAAPADGLRLGKAGSGGAVAYYRDAYRAGFYRVLTPDEKHFVAVNAPASEAKIAPVEMSTFKEKIRETRRARFTSERFGSAAFDSKAHRLRRASFSRAGRDIRRRGVPGGQDLKDAGDFSVLLSSGSDHAPRWIRVAPCRSTPIGDGAARADGTTRNYPWNNMILKAIHRLPFHAPILTQRQTWYQVENTTGARYASFS